MSTASILLLVLGVWSARAQFTFDHIGTGATGSLITNDQAHGSYELNGGGDDIWSCSDNFDFAHYQVTGDFDLRVQITSLEMTATWTKAGIMARESMDPTARMAFSRATPDTGANDVHFAYRTGTSVCSLGEHEDGGGAPGYPNCWLRLARSNETFYSYAGSNGVDWNMLGSQNTATWEGGAVAPTLQIGLGVSRHSGTDPIATCEFTNYSALPVAIAGQPQDRTVGAGNPAAFSVALGSGFGATFQWYRDGAPITGATNSTYTLSGAQLGDSGAAFSVAVTNSVNGLVSSAAMLTVTANPHLIDVSTRNDATGIYVSFDKAMGEDALNAANYSVTNSTSSIAVATATFLGGSNETVRLGLSAPLPLGVSYTVTVAGVHDPEGHIIAPDPSSGSFTHAAGIRGPQGLTRSIFLNITGGNVTDLTGNGAFPCSPSETDTSIPNMEYGTNPAHNNQGRGDTGDYGTWIYGEFVAPVTGNYVFGLASDDGGALYMSSDANPANKVQLTAMAAWDGYREYVAPTGSGQTPAPLSAPQKLVAGERYYLEALEKEGGGGDHVSVTVQLPGGAAIVNGAPSIDRSMFATNYIFGCPPQIFFSTLGPVFLTSQPVDATINETLPVTFGVGVDGAPPYAIQWYSNNVAIPGATGTRYTTAPLRYANGAQYQAIVQNGFSAVTSAVATLTIISDAVPPTLLGARADQTRREVLLTFSESIDLITASNAGNYIITNSAGVTLPIVSVRSLNASNIVLRTGVQGEGDYYTVVVNGILDRAGVPNPIAANTTATFRGFVFTPGFAEMDVYNTGGGNAVSIIKTSPTYPWFPRERYFITRINSRLAYPNDSHEAYGARIIGYFVPATNGAYTTYISSDDDSELDFSLDDNLFNASIYPVPGCCAAWASHAVGPLNLTENSRYAYELLYKEGTGGDYVGLSLDPNAPLPNANVLNTGVPSQLLGIYADPNETQIAFAQTPPLALTTVPNQYLSFTALATNTAHFPQSYQWQRWDSNANAFVNIPGAVGANAGTLFYGPTSFGDNGAIFRVIAYAPGSSITATTTVSVIADTVAPAVIAAVADPTFSQIRVTFSEPMSTNSSDGLLEALSYDVSGGLIIASVEYVSPTNVILHVDPGTSMVENTTYNISMVFGYDANGNAVDSSARVPFTSYVRAVPFVKYDFFLNVNGGAVADLLASPTYPNFPTVTYLTNNVDWPQSSPDMNNYGLKVSGYFRPPVTGNYTFYIKNDDGGQFQLSSDQTAEHLATVIAVGCCNGSFAAPATVPNLQAGGAYYFEAIVKEAGGGDYLTIGTTLPGSSTIVPLAGDLVTGAVYRSALAINPGFATQPETLTVEQNRSVTFAGTVTNAGGLGAFYQWEINTGTGWNDITGAIHPTYTTDLLPLSASGNIYRVRASTIAGTMFSDAATVTVTNDITAPAVVSAHGDATFRRIIVNFSEAMNTGAGSELLEPLSYTLNSGDPSYGISAVTLLSPTSVALTLEPSLSPLLQNTVYTVTVCCGTDLAGNALDPAHNSAQFTSLITGRGFARYDFYLNAGNSQNIIALFGNPKFPNFPDVTYYTNNLDWPQSNPDMSNYGLRMSGWFVPPVSGDYTFYIKNDDDGRFSLSTDADPAHLVTRIDAPCCNGNYAAPAVVTNLVAGQPYYFEAIVKEAGGGDYLSIGVVPPGGSTPVPVGAQYLAVIAPQGSGADIGIAAQPEDIAVLQNRRGTFSVTVTNAGPSGAAYQWQVDGGNGFTNIPGATASSYTTPPVSLDMSGWRYHVIVDVPGNVIVSSAALLTVIPDLDAPVPTLAHGTWNNEGVVVLFNEVLDPATAQDPANYVLGATNGIVPSVTNAVLSADGTSVLLGISPATAYDSDYTITVSGVKDLAANAMSAARTLDFHTWKLSRGSALFQVYLNIPGSAVNDLRSSSNYPAHPQIVRHVRAMDSRPAFPDDSHENYGARISGYFRPEATGDYNFYLRSDDASQLWLSLTNNNDPTNMVLLTEETGCCGNFSGHASAPVSLVGGGLYYTELVYKEGTGGDYGQAAVKLAGDPANPDSLAPYSGALLVSYADPMGASITITQQPISVLVTEAHTTTLSVGATATNLYGDADLVYQWEKSTDNGLSWTEIPGANGASYTTAAATAADEGAQYRVELFIPGAEATSAAAAISVFIPPKDHLTLNIIGDGTVSGATNGQLLIIGETYTLVATPGTNSVFVRWSGGVSGNSPTLTFVMQSNLVITANFAPDTGAGTSPVTLTIVGGGTVTGVTNGELLQVGQTYVVVATPAPGFVFAGYSGGVSGNSTTLTFVMQPNLVIVATFAVPTAPLNLTIVGQGTVAGATNGQLLEIGATYTIVATPAEGWTFSGWSGGVSETSTSLTFVMQSDLAIVATFVRAGPVPVTAGKFNGLFYDDAGDPAHSGLITLLVGPHGRYRLTLNTAGRHLVARGRFAEDGRATNTIRRAHENALTVVVALSADQSNQVTGVVTDGEWVANIHADRSVFNAHNHAPQAGRYTLIFQASGSPDAPPGDGYATVTVDANGTVRLRGRLVDGTLLMQNTRLSEDGNWPFYVPLYRGHGMLLGWLHFGDDGANDLFGTVHWSKPGSPEGLAEDMDVIGSKYTAPTGGAAVLPFTDGVVTLHGGVFPDSADPVTIQGSHVVSHGSDVLNMEFAPGNGTFHGTFRPAEGSTAVPIAGVALQRQNIASGFGASHAGSGRVRLEPTSD